ncbi:MAG TPA: dockerin type I domain-containing protein [Tepidisphaeraceae bacterium]
MREDLAALYGRSPAMHGRVDDAIVNAARAQLLSRRRRTTLYRVGSLAAAAAVILFALQLGLLRSHHAAPQPLAVAAQDLNQDGRVDILDALYLARALERAQSQASWDFNRDGQVDRKDADAIAASAVRLGSGGVQ